MATMNAQKSKSNSFTNRLRKDLKKNWMLYIMALPIFAYYIIFHYGPMGGLVIAFKDFRPGRGIWGSEWADFFGLEHFIDFFTSPEFATIVPNTIIISVVSILIGFPAPIILALLLNELKNEKFKKSVQTITYMPYFISVVVMSGIILDLVSSEGVITNIARFFGYQGGDMLGVSELFVPIFVTSNVWQNLGYGTIIYIAALANVSEDVYEAARIDGANRWQQMLNVTLPGIAPTITIMLIMRLGSIMTVGWEKIVLMYNPGIYETADVISSYIYRIGVEGNLTSYAAAIGMFNSVINFSMLLIANKVTKKLGGNSLW